MTTILFCVAITLMATNPTRRRARAEAAPTDPTRRATSSPASRSRIGCRSGRLSRQLSARSRRRSSARRSRRSTSTNMGASWCSSIGTTALEPMGLTGRPQGAFASARSGRVSIGARCLFRESARKTVSGLLGKSSTDGGSTIHNANAWWFDDAKGSEQFYVRARKDLYFRAYNNQNIRVGADVTETVGRDETINVGPVDEEAAEVGGSTGGGNFTLNSYETITLNVGPSDMPLTQIKMDQKSITLSVGPGGMLAQIRMDESGVTISSTPVSQLMVQPSGITTATPTVTVAFGPVTFASPSVTIPIATIGVANIGAGTVGGVMPLV